MVANLVPDKFAFGDSFFPSRSRGESSVATLWGNQKFEVGAQGGMNTRREVGFSSGFGFSNEETN